MRRVRVENSRSRPRSSVTLATTATRIAGTAAITANRPTMRTCSRAAARPRRRACTTSQTSRAMMPTSRKTVSALISSSVTTTSWVGAIGVRSASTTKVTSGRQHRERRRRAAPARASARLRRRRRRSRRRRPGPRWRCWLIEPRNDARGSAPAEPPLTGIDRPTDAFIQQCCRIATIPGRGQAPCHGTKPVAGTQSRQPLVRITWISRSRIFLRSVLRLSPEQVGGADLVAAGRRERRRQQRIFDLAQDAVIEAGRRQTVVEAREIARQMCARPQRRERVLARGSLPERAWPAAPVRRRSPPR